MNDYEQLVETAIKLYTEGNDNPSASQIALAAMMHDPPASPLEEPPTLGVDYGSVRKRLRPMVRELGRRGFAVCLITREAYLSNGCKSFVEEPPVDALEAWLCLPLYGRKAVGIHFRIGTDDPVWLASIGQEAIVARNELEMATDQASNLD
jgi:hypothetical protein